MNFIFHIFRALDRQKVLEEQQELSKKENDEKIKINSKNRELEIKNIKDDHFILLSENDKKIELLTNEKNGAVVSAFSS